MNNFFHKKFQAIAGAFWLCLLMVSPNAMAVNDLKTAMGTMSQQGRSAQELIVVAIWVFGAWMGWKFVKSLEAHKEDKREMPIGKVMGYALTAILAFAIPEFMGMGVTSIFGGGAQTLDVNSQTFSIAR